MTDPALLNQSGAQGPLSFQDFREIAERDGLPAMRQALEGKSKLELAQLFLAGARHVRRQCEQHLDSLYDALDQDLATDSISRSSAQMAIANARHFE